MHSPASELDYPDGPDIQTQRAIACSIATTIVDSGQSATGEIKEVFDYNFTLSTKMVKAAETMSCFITDRLKEIDHVQAVLIGRSGDVHHVWVMTKEWTSAGRKEIYAAQRDLLKKLNGFEMDFYVVPFEPGMKPGDFVSDIPVMYQRPA
jgi:hypothetical protein